jgi:hypothetical protein
MLTLKFHSEEELAEFVEITNLYRHPVNVDYEHLDVQGELPEAELELARNAFDVDVEEMQNSKFKLA